MAEEATVNTDGSTTFNDGGESAPPPPMNESMPGDNNETMFGDDDEAKAEGGVDPAFYLLGAFAVVVLLLMLYKLLLKKKQDTDGDDFFASLDTEKFNLKLPSEVEEYYKIKAKCEEAGWEPRSVPNPREAAAANGPHRVLAQALMKRAIADIPILQHIQRESPGMNKLYSQSMCSEKQWRAYQHAEALVSAEVSEVREEADQVEPGWSQGIWRQAMQYHQMLKQRHEQETKAAEAAAAAAKKTAEPKKSPEQLQKEKEQAAEKAAQELLKQEEQEKQKGNKAFGSGSKLKKGFLDNNSKGKKK